MGKTLRNIFIAVVIAIFNIGTIDAQWEQPDTIKLELSTCDSTVGWCLDIPQGDLSNYTIELNGATYNGSIGGCEVDTFVAYTYAPLFGQGQLGPYFLDSWTVNDQTFSGTFQNTAALVDSMNIWDPNGNWEDFSANSFILGGQPGSTYSGMEITAVLLGITTTLQANPQDSTPEGTLIQFDRGVHELVVTETLTGVSMQSLVLIGCPQNVAFTNELLINTLDTLCFDTIDLGLVGNMISITPTCPFDNEVVNTEIVNQCSQILGIDIGMDTICYEICDEYDFCASFQTVVNVFTDDEVFTQDIIYDIPYGTDSLHCFDVSMLDGSVTEIIQTCSNSNDPGIIFDPLDETSFCIHFNSVVVGTDMVCYNFIADNGNILIVHLIVNGLPPSPSTENIEMMLGDSIQICPDISELATGVDTIYNSCESIVTNSVIFEINNVSLCMNAVAQSIGLDTTCLVICDQNEICDTTFYHLTVLDSNNSPSLVANNDSESTYLNNSVVINYCGNDIIPNNALDDFYLLSPSEGGTEPLYGNVTFNNDCTLTYKPDEGVCNVVDTFAYVICNQDTCAQAQITVFIDCEIAEMEIKTGFSPNFDGDNETFMIDGLENYPNNRLRIYNRWGSKVFDQENYQNDWWGDWNGQPVPDGTYFYLLTTREGFMTSGYVQIMR